MKRFLKGNVYTYNEYQCVQQIKENPSVELKHGEIDRKPVC